MHVLLVCGPLVGHRFDAADPNGGMESPYDASTDDIIKPLYSEEEIEDAVETYGTVFLDPYVPW